MTSGAAKAFPRIEDVPDLTTVNSRLEYSVSLDGLIWRRYIWSAREPIYVRGGSESLSSSSGGGADSD
jgi:hypothetical protein